MDIINELDNEEDVLIAIQRIKDLHNPMLVANNDKKEQLTKNFDKFALSLLLAYVDLVDQDSSVAATVALHLKDIVVRANNKEGGGSLAIIGYLKQ